MNHEAICARLPHAGRMCLLDRIDHWDESSITCFAVSHRDADNPLRSYGRLHAVNGVEYAAQAMALHGSLLSGPDSRPAMGYLASVRSLELNAEDLAAVPQDLRIVAQRLSGDASSFIYAFEIHAGDQCLLSGRVAAKLVGIGA